MKELNCPNCPDLTMCVYKSSIILDFQEMQFSRSQRQFGPPMGMAKSISAPRGHLLSVTAQSSVPRPLTLPCPALMHCSSQKQFPRISPQLPKNAENLNKASLEGTSFLFQNNANKVAISRYTLAHGFFVVT